MEYHLALVPRKHFCLLFMVDFFRQPSHLAIVSFFPFLFALPLSARPKPYLVVPNGFGQMKKNEIEEAASYFNESNRMNGHQQPKIRRPSAEHFVPK